MIWDKVYKNGPSKICGRQPLKNLKEYGLSSKNFTWSILEYCVPSSMYDGVLSRKQLTAFRRCKNALS